MLTLLDETVTFSSIYQSTKTKLNGKAPTGLTDVSQAKIADYIASTVANRIKLGKLESLVHMEREIDALIDETLADVKAGKRPV